MVYEQYLDCLEACNHCAQACDSCATECLREKNVHDLVRCIELDRACAQACRAAAGFMALGSDWASRYCALCAEICHTCGEECGKHEHMKYCKECARMCFACAEKCREMSGAHV
ncbi:MAG: four-helix bundle copper-binding protein [Candidatus Omnitrophica bacterium]|nr:four-helix bundle copper-binding protein [Candidatus Omnitrophota bacterium]MDE2223477.1 four-helix bundle copper-binding protein [Candidatus Omnitrophota bacterium]